MRTLKAIALVGLAASVLLAQPQISPFGCSATVATNTAWTTATSINTTQLLVSSATSSPAISFVVNGGANLTAGAITFQADYGDGNFVTIPAALILAPAMTGLANPYTLVASTNQAFFIYLSGAQRVQLKLSTAITTSGGTGSTAFFTTQVCYLPSVESLNQIAGTTIDANSGNKSAGTQRVVLATDQPALTNKLLVTPDANVKVNVVGNAGANLDAATGAAPPANAILHAGLGSGATGGFLTAMPVCDSFFAINISTATTTLAVTGVSGRHVRICGISLLSAAADNVGIISGTGATCGTGTGAIVGTTAATGYNFPANGGIAYGSGIGTIMRTVATGDSVCIITGAATQHSGHISYTIY